MPEPDRARLRAIRAGTAPLDEVLDDLDDVSARLEALARTAGLPPEGDAGRIDRFLIEAHEAAWTDGGETAPQ